MLTRTLQLSAGFLTLCCLSLSACDPIPLPPPGGAGETQGEGETDEGSDSDDASESGATGTGTDSDTATGTDGATATGTGTDSDTASGTDGGAGTGTGQGADTGTGGGTGTGTDTGTDGGTGTGTGTDTGTDDGTGTEPSPDGVFEIASSKLPRVKDAPLTPKQRDAMRRGNVDLSFDLLANHERNNGNLAVSAMSLRGAFGMVHAMAKGQTQAQIAATLGLDPDPKIAWAAFNDLDLTLASRNLKATKEQDPVIVRSANRVFLPQGQRPAKAFLDVLAQYFGSAAYLANFAGNADATRAAINAWVSERTNKLIPELLNEEQITPDTAWTLVNAMYFRGPWFKGAYVLDDKSDFHLMGGETKKAEFVEFYETDLPHGKSSDLTWVKVPLRGGAISMLFLVPDLGSFAKVRSELNAQRLDQMLAKGRKGTGTFRFPKFKINSQRLSLVEYLREKGMELAFTTPDFGAALENGANLPPIGSVIQSCVVAVDEIGVEAAAATVAASDESDDDGGLDFNFSIDRPFLFAVLDEPTGTMLFSGQVLDPTLP